MTWLCMNCQRLVELTQHGRCEHCNSDAVCCSTPASAEPGMTGIERKRLEYAAELADLERMGRL